MRLKMITMENEFMTTRLEMFKSLTHSQRGMVMLIFFAFFIVPGYAVFSVANSASANRVLGQIESVTLTNVNNTIETSRLF